MQRNSPSLDSRGTATPCFQLAGLTLIGGRVRTLLREFYVY